MKKLSLFIIFLLLITVGTIQTVKITESNEVEVEDSHISRDADLSFVVLGDVHNDASGLKSAINDFYKLNRKIDALVLNGDTVDQGKDEQYEEMNNVLIKNKNKLPDTIIKNIGNHEFYNYDENTNTLEHMKDFMNKHLKFAGTEKIYHDTWVNDYHFISLGSDDLEDENFNTTAASLTKEQFSWLKEKLKEGYVKGKPIFVFLHQPINVEFFGNPWYGVKQGDELVRLLNQYPEVILFSSHTHKEFVNDYIQKNLNFTRIHTGAVSYTIVKDGGEEYGYSRKTSYNNGLYVEVKGNEVIINGRNIADNTWVFTEIINKGTQN